MAERPITIVMGLARCGTSLMCQMLEAAGLEVNGEWPAFEAEETNQPIDWGWIGEQRGKVTKLLPTDELELPPGDYRVLWLSRDPMEQSKSTIKFATTLLGFGGKPKSSMVKRMARGIVRDTKRWRRVMHQRGIPVLPLRFERLIDLHSLEVFKVIKFLELDTNADVMQRCIVARRPQCLPGLDLEAMLIDQRPEGADGGAA